MVDVSDVASEWASSGLASLTGLPDGRPDFSRANVLARAQQVAAAVQSRIGVAIDAGTLLAGRGGTVFQADA